MNNKINFDVIANNRQEFWKTIENDYHESNTSKIAYRRKAIANVIKLNNIKSVLELGCNSGGNLLYILKESPNIKACGIDINDRAIKYGKEVENNAAELIAGSIYNLEGFGDKSFDMVFTCTCLLHIPHIKIQDILKEMVRIASKYVINIERNGSDSIQSYGNDGSPHSFSHNYLSRYSNIGISAQIKNMMQITKYKRNHGGADHFVWANLTDEKLILP